jgi:hypothetical protein
MGPWILGAGVLLALGVAALIVALVSGSGSTIPGGPDTATIHVTLSPTGQSSFSGTVAGKALTGTVTNPTPPPIGSGSGSLSLNGLVLFNYRGRLGGTPFVLHVSLASGANTTEVPIGQFTFDVTGTYGSRRVTGSAGFDLASEGAASQTVTFNGLVGQQPVAGTATAVRSGDGNLDVTARLSAFPTG